MLDLLLPQRCLACGRSGALVCTGCVARLPPIAPPLCERCGAPTAWPVARCRECSGRRLAFAAARAAVAYDDAVRRIVGAWKERGLRLLSRLAADVVVGALARPEVATVTFVPGDADRALRRGHTPAERLSADLARAWELPHAALLARVRSTPRQRSLPLATRRRNVSGVFVPRGRAPLSVLLVDDVYTSGATASAAASALRKGGARRVEVVTFARAVR